MEDGEEDLGLSGQRLGIRSSVDPDNDDSGISSLPGKIIVLAKCQGRIGIDDRGFDVDSLGKDPVGNITDTELTCKSP